MIVGPPAARHRLLEWIEPGVAHRLQDAGPRGLTVSRPRPSPRARRRAERFHHSANPVHPAEDNPRPASGGRWTRASAFPRASLASRDRSSAEYAASANHQRIPRPATRVRPSPHDRRLDDRDEADVRALRRNGKVHGPSVRPGRDVGQLRAASSQVRAVPGLRIGSEASYACDAQEASGAHGMSPPPVRVRVGVQGLSRPLDLVHVQLGRFRTARRRFAELASRAATAGR